MNVTYWSDYACPFCYIGITHLMKAAEELEKSDSLELQMRAFELDPNAPTTCESDTVDRFGAKYGLSHEQALERVEEISELGRESGIDFRYATTRNTNTFDAHRLTKLAQATDETIVQVLELHLYDAYFTQNVELADHVALREVALRAGLDADDVDRVLASDEYADEVRLDEREALMRGIHGVPYFIIAGKTVVPGCLGIEQFKTLLEKAFDEERAMRDVDAFGVCGPDGCEL